MISLKNEKENQSLICFINLPQLAAAKLCGGPFAKLLAPGLKTMMLDAVNASPEDKVGFTRLLTKT
jgi:hypothetical protein